MPIQIYIVEDDAALRYSLVNACETLCNGKVVGWASRQDQAIEWLARHADQWQLAVVDVVLEQGRGFGVLGALRQRAPEQKVFVLSNAACDSLRVRCGALGADAVFDKTTQLDAFLAQCSMLGSTAASQCLKP